MNTLAADCLVAGLGSPAVRRELAEQWLDRVEGRLNGVEEATDFSARIVGVLAAFGRD